MGASPNLNHNPSSSSSKHKHSVNYSIKAKTELATTHMPVHMSLSTLTDKQIHGIFITHERTESKLYYFYLLTGKILTKPSIFSCKLTR